MPTIQRNSHLVVAQTLLSLIEVRLNEGEENRWIVECYANGREQGYCLSTWCYHIAFSEYRNSDSIVVYNGELFGMQGNTPDERAYKNARHFNYNEYEQAAEYVLELMRAVNQKTDKLFADAKADSQ